MKLSCTLLALSAALLAGTAQAEDLSASISSKLRGSHCNYRCPANSERKPHRNCYNNFDDCECRWGYEKKHSKCVKECKDDFRCPAHSTPKHGRHCYDSFDDCACDWGYEKKHGKCVYRDQCYNCPANSHEKNSKFCGQTFHDNCECDHGYEKKHDKCVYKEPCFQCPKNSHEKNSKYCGQTFHDTCECDYGYEKKHDKCVKKDHCYNDYQCPRHSSRKPHRECYDSFKDCKCDYGYEKKHGKCVKEEYVPKCYTRYIAHLDSATGSETLPFGVLEFNEETGLTFLGAYDNDVLGAAFDGHKMHIHNEPVASVGDCASTGGHYDPAGIEIEGYSCDPENRETCYVGDLTGKFGKVFLDGEEEVMGQFLFSIESVLGRGVVLHAPGTGARIACGTIEAYVECE